MYYVAVMKSKTQTKGKIPKHMEMKQYVSE